MDYLVLEIPNNPYIIDCLSVLMPYAVPLRMGLYKDASNIVNGAINPSSHVIFWEKYINISRNVHVYHCKQTTYVDKFAGCSAATFQYNYRKLFGVRKAVSSALHRGSFFMNYSIFQRCSWPRKLMTSQRERSSRSPL